MQHSLPLPLCAFSLFPFALFVPACVVILGAVGLRGQQHGQRQALAHRHQLRRRHLQPLKMKRLLKLLKLLIHWNTDNWQPHQE